MKGVFGLLLVGGGVVLVYGLFTGKITFPGATPASTNLGALGGILGTTPPQTSNPKAPGYVPPVNNKCPSGQVWDTKTGQCIPVA